MNIAPAPLIKTDTAYSLPAIGALAQLVSGGPHMTVTAVHPPLPGDPAGAVATINAMCFREDGSLLTLTEVDVRCFKIFAA